MEFALHSPNSGTAPFWPQELGIFLRRRLVELRVHRGRFGELVALGIPNRRTMTPPKFRCRVFVKSFQLDCRQLLFLISHALSFLDL